MNAETHKLRIVANINQAASNQLIEQLSVLAAENDSLREEVAKLKEQLSPKPKSEPALSA